MLSRTASVDVSETSNPNGMLCVTLSQGIHAAAQPLSILRASLDRDYVDRMSLDELRKLAATSAAQVERVCTLFSLMQQMVNIETVKPRLMVTSIPPLISYATEGVNLLFEKQGIRLVSTVRDSSGDVAIDRERTLQALTTVLLLALEASSHDGVVELVASGSAGRLVVGVGNQDAFSDSLNAESCLSMALAEANVISQGGAFAYTTKPFNVRMSFEMELPAL